MEYEKKQKIKFIAFVIFVYIFCAFLMTLGLVHYFDDHEIKEAIADGIVVEAEYVKVIPHSTGSSVGWSGGEYYNVRYEYTDKDGVKYEGEVGVFQKREEAELYVGKKVDIYIGYNGHSIPVFKSGDFNENSAWWLMGFAIGIAVCYTVALIIWGAIMRRQKKNKSGNEIVNDIGPIIGG